MSAIVLLPALAMGILGSPHCMGMCGGIVTAFGISMSSLSPKKRTMLIITYHLGRLISYTALGLLATVLGEQILAKFLTDSAMPRIILGVAIVFAALLMLGVPILTRLEKLGLGLWNTMSPIRQKILPIDSLPKALLAGILWGFLPCGMVYGALAVAMSVSATAQVSGLGVLFMLVFGIGTIPMLLVSGVMMSWLQTKIKAFNLRKFSGAILLVSGVVVMLSPTVMHHFHDHGGHDHSHHSHHHHH